MELKIEDKVVGTIYCNLKFDALALGYSKNDLTEKIKDGEFSVTLNGKSVKIDSFRRMYVADDTLCIEGAKLSL